MSATETERCAEPVTLGRGQLMRRRGIFGLLD